MVEEAVPIDDDDVIDTAEVTSAETCVLCKSKPLEGCDDGLVIDGKNGQKLCPQLRAKQEADDAEEESGVKPKEDKVRVTQKIRPAKRPGPARLSRSEEKSEEKRVKRVGRLNRISSKTGQPIDAPKGAVRSTEKRPRRQPDPISDLAKEVRKKALKLYGPKTKYGDIDDLVYSKLKSGEWSSEDSAEQLAAQAVQLIDQA